MSTSKPIASAFKQVGGGKTLADANFIRNAIIYANNMTSTYGIAAAGTNAATATQLSAVMNQVDTVAASTGVNLPLSTGKINTPCQICFVVNNGANALTVYGYNGSSDTINGASSVTQSSGSSVLYCSVKGGAWFTVGMIDASPSGNTGTFTANGSTAVTVANASLTANSVISYGLKTVGGTPGAKPYEASVTPGTGFTVKAAAGDTSVYNYTIVG